VTSGASASDTKVQRVPLEIGAAQGLLWAYDSLYVVINGRFGEYVSGLYRLRDIDGDDNLDEIETLKLFKDRNNTGPAGSEHGPHAVVLGPDGMLYIVAGNFTNIPDGLSPTSPAANWGEDLLLERAPDGRGHDPHIMAPGGWVARTDKDGKTWELLTVGMRNAYDIAFNPAGELFGYDSDMEWDIGTPWHRPTRVVHVTSGAEWGWRNGSGKWPAYYPDSLPPTVETGLGSPTGVTFGTTAKFPARYRNALFAADWAYGKIHAVHLKPDGSSYSGTYEPFVSGKPFGVTDVVINHDGAMYITTGGRKTQSGLYRVTYVGDEPTGPATPADEPAAVEARALRHKIESLHGRRGDAQDVSLALAHVGHDDRFIRYAARVALEFQDRALWQAQALAPAASPTASINMLLALCRVADSSLQPRVLEALDRLTFEQLSKEQKLELLRTYGLCFIRMGRPNDSARSRYAERWGPLFPSGDVDLDHELAQLLVYVDSPQIIEKSLAMIAKSPTQEEQLFYAFILRHIKDGWTPAQRETYFKWLRHAEENYRGGASFTLFIQHMRDEAVATLAPQEKLALGELTEHSGSKRARPTAPARKFVRSWTMKQLVPVLEKATTGRNFATGKAAFEATACLTCHRFNNEGGAAGPDITGAGSRFSPNDLLETIIEPSKVISDQYQATEFISKNDVVSGTIVSEDANTIVVRPSALSNLTVNVSKRTLIERRPSKLSTMPAGLIDVLTENEILDLLAYIRAAGNPNDPAFQKTAPISGAAP
jgi:putative heme-binding domain-containing protein